jgi:hypothetical protein
MLKSKVRILEEELEKALLKCKQQEEAQLAEKTSYQGHLDRRGVAKHFIKTKQSICNDGFQPRERVDFGSGTDHKPSFNDDLTEWSK